MRVIIPCGGDGQRWGNYTGVPKQLTFIEGEILLERTIKQCRQYTNDIWIIAQDQQIEELANKLNVNVTAGIQEHVNAIDKVLCSTNLWTKHYTTILFGDTYFTDEALTKIFQINKHDPIFYGRFKNSEFTGKKGWEIYGMKFGIHNQFKFLSHCQYIKWAAHAGYIKEKMICIKMALISMDCHRYITSDPTELRNLCTIDDWTEDFDEPEGLILWLQGRKKYGLGQGLKTKLEEKKNGKKLGL